MSNINGRAPGPDRTDGLRFRKAHADSAPAPGLAERKPADGLSVRRIA